MSPLSSTLIISQNLAIPGAELQWRFTRSSGPGGQNVNKLETAVELLFDLQASAVLGEVRRQRLLERLGSKVSSGVLRVVAAEHRSQWRNRQLALERLAQLLREGLKSSPPPRRATKPTRGSQCRRLDAKKQRGQLKQQRQRRHHSDD